MPFQLSDCDAVGFDLDMTLCRYKLSPFINLCYRAISMHLVEKMSYPTELLSDFSLDEMKMIAKHQIIEWKNEGSIDIFFVNEEGIITRTLQTIQAGVKTVAAAAKWPHVDTLARECVWESSDVSQYWTVDSIWDMYLPILIVRLNQLRVDGHCNLPNSQIIADILQAQKYEMSDSIDFANDERLYYKSIRNDPLVFISPLPQVAIDGLRELGGNKKVFLMTSSHDDYAKFILDIIMVENGKPINYWDIFHFCIADARKPGFFNKTRPFLSPTSGNMADLKQGNWYTTEVDLLNLILTILRYLHGNMADLEGYFMKTLQVDQLQVGYFGDSLESDIISASKYGWKCVYLLEELHQQSKDHNELDRVMLASQGTGSPEHSRQSITMLLSRT